MAGQKVDVNREEVKVAYDDIKQKHEKLQDAYKKYFPKVDPKLIEDLFLHSATYQHQENRLNSLQINTSVPICPGMISHVNDMSISTKA